MEQKIILENNRFELNNLTLKIEKENAKAMIEGYIKNGRTIKTSIYTAQSKSWSITNNFRTYPKLITLKVSPPRKEYPLSQIGNELKAGTYYIDNKYVAFIDTIYHIIDKIELWQDLCNDDTFDIWSPEAPYNSVNGKEDPMILLLRIYEIDQVIPWDKIDTNSNVYFGTIKDKIYVNIKQPLISNEEFSKIKNNLDKKILKHNSQSKNPEQINDTITMNLHIDKDFIDQGNNIWWVNQGKTQDIEVSNNLIWAPIKQNDGKSKYFWDLLSKVKKDDIVLHYSNGALRYVSRVIEPAILAKRPQSVYENNWQDDGRLIRLEYYELNPIIPLQTFNSKISSLNIYQGPLDSSNGIKQGYLFKFSRAGLKIIQESQRETIWPEFAVMSPNTNEFKSWIFQANPEFYDLRSAVKYLKEINWKVSRYKKEIHKGDLVYLWEGGQNAGIVAVATIITEPGELVKDELEKPYIKNDEVDDTSNLRVRIKINHILEMPLLKEQLLKNPVLANTQIIRAPMGSNFSVSQEEANELKKLIHFDKSVVLPDIIAPKYTIDDFIKDTGFGREIIEAWERQLIRKKHIVFQGPPGTGKTFVAQKLANLMISETSGLTEVVQFHPAYTYEDFIQGLRPIPNKEGLSYELEEGRFLQFCRKAKRANGAPCILIIDEINRANLSKVFGELMYLLEYRDQEIPLAAGGAPFKIPMNVYIIGTMNSADRSIALVDNAIRRRFSFIRLNPDYDILKKYLDVFGYPANSLISVLKEVNTAIDDQNYEIGVSYFIKDADKLKDNLPDIWKSEIEPYLEEYFYDQPTKVNSYRWNSLSKDKLKDWYK